MSTPSVMLHKSDVKGFIVTLGPQVLFNGGRIAAKKFANRYCWETGRKMWLNQKVGGRYVEVKV